jgi:sugar phosphate isomerase/epimerase
MDSNVKRREFLKVGSAAVLGAALANLGGRRAAAAEKVRCSSPTAARMGWLVGVQQYTFRRFSLYEMLDMMVDLGIQHVETGFFLPLDKARPGLQTNQDLSPEVRTELKKKLADRGITQSAFYAQLDADADRAKRIFEFCKEMGTGTIVAEPPGEAFDMIEKLCDEYQVDLAIHNHPRSPKSQYWRPENVLAACRGRGKRIGACCDTGHWVRSGLDPVECLGKLEGRVLGFHLKDVIESGKPKARDVPLGEGKANYAAVLKELHRQGYRGVLTIEYEHDSPELMADVAKCVAFVEEMAGRLGR